MYKAYSHSSLHLPLFRWSKSICLVKHEKLKRCSLKLTTFLSGKRIAEAATCNLNILDIDAAKCVLVLFSRHHVSPDLNHRFWASTEFSEAGTVEFPKSPTSSAAMLPQMPQTRTTMTHPGEGCYGRIVLLHICIKIMIIIILHKNPLWMHGSMEQNLYK